MTADLVIVGGGIVGVMAAYWAATRSPLREIVIIERSLIGGGATQHSGGHNHRFGFNAQQRELAAESQPIFEELRTALPSVDLFDVPFVGLVSRRLVRQTLAGFITPDARTVDIEQVRGKLPAELVQHGQQLIDAGMGSYGLPHAIANTIAAHLRRTQCAEIWEGADVTALSDEGSHARLWLRDGRTVSGRHVLIATGPWLACAGPGHESAAAAGLKTKKIVALHVESPPPPGAAIVYLFDDDAYLLPNGVRGHYILSFAVNDWNCSVEASALAVSPADRALGLGILSRYFPSLEHRCVGARVFCDAYTSTRLPYIERVAETERAVAVGGCSGYGFRLAPAIARRALAKAFDRAAWTATSAPRVARRCA
jgi:glycine/D-amino acid oxidase-like deaminating enzyme